MPVFPLPESRLLQEPPQPGFFRRCPECRALFALKLIERENPDELGLVLSIFECRKCEKLTAFADSHPKGAI